MKNCEEPLFVEIFKISEDFFLNGLEVVEIEAR